MVCVWQTEGRDAHAAFILHPIIPVVCVYVCVCVCVQIWCFPTVIPTYKGQGQGQVREGRRDRWPSHSFPPLWWSMLVLPFSLPFSLSLYLSFCMSLWSWSLSCPDDNIGFFAPVMSHHQAYQVSKPLFPPTIVVNSSHQNVFRDIYNIEKEVQEKKQNTMCIIEG